MIIIKVELHSAQTGEVRELGRCHISNDGTSGDLRRGNYLVELFRKGSKTKVQRRGLVQNYPRQAYTVWELVRRGLEAALGKWPIHPGHPEEFDEEVNQGPVINGNFYIDSEEADLVSLKQFMDAVKKTQKQLTKLSEDGYGKQYQELTDHDKKVVDEFKKTLESQQCQINKNT